MPPSPSTVADPEPFVPQLACAIGSCRAVVAVVGIVVANARPRSSSRQQRHSRITSAQLVESCVAGRGLVRAWSVVGSAREIGIGPTSRATQAVDQYESDERTSPPRMVFRPIQTTGLIGLLDEVHRAVAEAGVHAAGVAAARAGVEVEERERDRHAGQLSPGSFTQNPSPSRSPPPLGGVGDAVEVPRSYSA